LPKHKNNLKNDDLASGMVKNKNVRGIDKAIYKK
jgi:hypothetical protein